MASATITKRRRSDGKTRYVVRYRLGGRAYPVQHAGSFPVEREAKIRRDLVAGELAAGRNPAILLRQLRAAPTVETFKRTAARYEASVPQLSVGSFIRTLTAAFGDQDPHLISWQDVQEWIAASGLKPRSVQRYVGVLRSVLDYADCDPNPARDDRLKLPRIEQVDINPPSATETALIVQHAADRHRLAVTTLAETGMRVGELCALEWGDVDVHESRVLVRRGKTHAARRWVAVPDDTLSDILRATPHDDRTGRVFPQATEDAIASTIRHACKAAGITAYSPHDLRHRYISIQVKRGAPITDIAAQVGHSKKSITLDTYAHVLID